MPSLTFSHPAYWLLLAPIAGLFWLIARRSDAPLAPDQIRQSLILRCLAGALILAAVCGPLARTVARNQGVMLLIDVSRSISPSQRAQEFDLARRILAAKPKGDSAGVIAFAADPAVIETPADTQQPITDGVPVNDESTDIAAAVRTAAEALTARQGRQIVLLTDGNETSVPGSALRAASDVGVPVSVVDPQQFLGTMPAEASVVRVDLPASVHDGEPVNARVVLASSVAQSATLTMRSGGSIPRKQTVQLVDGKTLIDLPITLHGSGLHQVEVGVDAPSDTILENNRGMASTQVIGKPRILYLTDSPRSIGATLQRAMVAQAITLDIKSPTEAPEDVAGFAAYDEVVLSNVPSAEMALGQQSALQSAVRDFGVGLGMVGGTNSFVSGDWAGTPIEQTLPVIMQPRRKKKMNAADIVVVLDASSSMSAEENGIEKVQLGARAAVSLLGSLQPDDRVAVIAVTTEPKVVLPFSKPKDALAARAQIEGVAADGGGIYCLTGLEAAYDMLDSSKAPIKHVVICADTSDSEQQENCVDLAHTMRTTEHISTSVCGIGQWSDSDVGFQRQLAAAGGGQLYVASQAVNLPTFFARDIGHFETPPFFEGVFQARMMPNTKVLVGLDAATAPPLLGYNNVTARPGATVAMTAPADPDPILAYKTYGLGHTFAFTSDETDHWAARWLPWPGYEQLWAQLLRWSLRGDKPADFQAFADLNAGSTLGHVVVDAFAPDGGYLNGAVYNVTIAGPNAPVRTMALTQTEPGRYEAQFPAAKTGSYLLTVSRAGRPEDGQATLGVAQAYAAEYAQLGPNLPMLREIADATGGRWLSDPSNVWRYRPDMSAERTPLTAICLLSGLLLFILDIAWRRLGLRMRPRRLIGPAMAAVSSVASSAQAGIAAGRAAAGAMSAPRTDRVRAADPREDDAILSRPICPRVHSEDRSESSRDDEAFPLVASLDDRRRRERAQDEENQRF